jgi:hypothetical protein
MPEEIYENPEQQYFSDVNTRLRDIEEKQRLLKDRTLLIGKNLIDDRESSFNEMQELKKEVLLLKEQNRKMQEILKRITEHVSDTARKEEVLILQRQFDMFRK